MTEQEQAEVRAIEEEIKNLDAEFEVWQEQRGSCKSFSNMPIDCMNAQTTKNEFAGRFSVRHSVFVCHYETL